MKWGSPMRFSIFFSSYGCILFLVNYWSIFTGASGNIRTVTAKKLFKIYYTLVGSAFTTV